MVNQTDLFRDALVKVLAIARSPRRGGLERGTGHRDQGFRRGEEEGRCGDSTSATQRSDPRHERDVGA